MPTCGSQDKGGPPNNRGTLYESNPACSVFAVEAEISRAFEGEAFKPRSRHPRPEQGLLPSQSWSIKREAEPCEYSLRSEHCSPAGDSTELDGEGAGGNLSAKGELRLFRLVAAGVLHPHHGGGLVS